MKLLLDTDVVLDVLLKREPFFDDSYECIAKAISNGDRLLFSSSAVTDVYYIARKYTSSKKAALDSVIRILQLADYVSVDEECVLNAICSSLDDFEDAVMESAAVKENIDYIISRNLEDFRDSSVKAIDPARFIQL